MVADRPGGRQGEKFRKVQVLARATWGRCGMDFTLMPTGRGRMRRVSEEHDPSADAVYDIRAALLRLNPDAAQVFIDLYLGKPEEYRSLRSLAVAILLDPKALRQLRRSFLLRRVLG